MILSHSIRHTSKNFYTLLVLSLLPCIMWGLASWGCKVLGSLLDYPSFLEDHHIYRLNYLLRLFTFLPLLMGIYKKFLSSLYDNYQKVYISCSVLAVIAIVSGLWVKTKFGNYLLDGCLVSPLIEEVIARLILYEVRHRSWRMYLVVAIITSLSFALMHFGYKPDSFTQSFTCIVWKLYQHFIFSIILCTIFWFIPKLHLLIILHALSNLLGILLTFSEI